MNDIAAKWLMLARAGGLLGMLFFTPCLFKERKKQNI